MTAGGVAGSRSSSASRASSSTTVAREPLNAAARLLSRYEHAGAALVEDRPQAVWRVTGVKRDVCAAGLEDPQRADHECGRLINAQAYQALTIDAQSPETVGQPIGIPLKLAVGERRIRGADATASGARRAAELNSSWTGSSLITLPTVRRGRQGGNEPSRHLLINSRFTQKPPILTSPRRGHVRARAP